MFTPITLTDATKVSLPSPPASPASPKINDNALEAEISAIRTNFTDPTLDKRVKRILATPKAVQEVAKLRDDTFGRGKYHPRNPRFLPKTNADTETGHPPTSTTITSTTTPQPAHKMASERESPEYFHNRSEPRQLPDPGSLKRSRRESMDNSTSETEYQTENNRIKRSQITFSDHNLICDFDGMEAPGMSLGVTKVVSDVLTGREDKPRPRPRPRPRLDGLVSRPCLRPRPHLDGPAISLAPEGFIQENVGSPELAQSYSWLPKMNHIKPKRCTASWPRLERTADITVKLGEEPMLRVGKEFLRSGNYNVLYDIYGIS